MWREKSAPTSTAFGHLSVDSDLGKDSLCGVVAVEARAGCREMKVKEVKNRGTYLHDCFQWLGWDRSKVTVTRKSVRKFFVVWFSIHGF